MRIVVDTNVVISAIFFGGTPRKVIEAVADGAVEACANPEIVEEYREVVAEMIMRRQGHLRRDLFNFYLARLEITDSASDIHLCRDPDDDKFISCAIDAKALYIVSGDKDLLDVRKIDNIEVVTAAEFCSRYGL